MYPYIIILNSNELKEHYNGNLYDYISNINDINKQIYKFIEEIIDLYSNKIKYDIEENTLNWNRFCEVVNAQPYDDSIFFNVKFFDYKTKMWHDYVIEEIVLELEFIKIIKKIFKKKIKLSANVIKCIDKVNSKKIKSYKNKNISKSELIVEL